MERWLYLSEVVDIPFGTVVDRLAERGRHLLDGGDDGVRADGSFGARVHVPGVPFNPVLEATLGVAAVRAGGRRVIPLTWHAQTASFAFPEFRGSLEVEPLADGVTRFSVVGRYEPPLGPIGMAFDATVLHGVAERTGRAVLQRVVHRTQAPELPTADDLRPSELVVRDLMSTAPYVVHDDMPLKTAALLLHHLQISGAPVVGEGGALVGVLTERDMLDKIGRVPLGFGKKVRATLRRHDAITAGQACSRPARTTAPDVPLGDAVDEMRKYGIGRLVVVSGTRIVGILSRHDVLSALVRNDEDLGRQMDAVLERLGERNVEAVVEWGLVHLSGKATLRSRAAELRNEADRIDGVIDVVTDDLGWETDDVSALPTSPLF